MSIGLNFALEVFHCLWYSSVFVQGSQWKAYTKARELYLIAWPVGLVDCPSPWRAAVHFDGLVLSGNEYIFLNGWAGAIQAEISPPVVGFGGI